MNSREGNKFRYYLVLSKIKIMLPVALTGFTGYFIYYPHLTAEILLLSLGILFLAVSASILNQIQEVNYDVKMDRTRNRPLPAGKISLKASIIFLLALSVTGSFLILGTGSLEALLISYFTILWYNGIYTLLKRVTPFAVIPGALTGALPPLIGWVAAGGSFTDRTILILQLLFFTGQIPHFWLFILKYGDEYESAGLPSLTSILEKKKIRMLILILTIATVCAAICLYFFGLIQNRIIVIILIIASVILMAAFIPLALIRQPEKKEISGYSLMLDSYYLLIIILLISDKIFHV